jgi:hypothetical protein
MSTYTKAADVAAEVAARLSLILLANACETNIGRDVMRGRRMLPEDDKPPCIIIIEGNDDLYDTPGRIPSCHTTLPFIIDAFDVCDANNPNDKAHAMIRDIKRAIFKDGATLGGRVRSVKYAGRDIGPRPDGVALVQARVMIEVEFVEDLQNP